MTVILHVDTAPALLLRPWRDEDLDDLVEAYRDPGLRRGARKPIKSAEQGVEWLNIQHAGWENGERFSFAVLDEGVLVGNVVLNREDPRGASGEVGYWTAAHARGKGVAPRALEALTGWAFATFPELKSLELLHQVDNAASCRVAEKTGYRFDGIVPADPPAYPKEGHRHVRTA